MEHFFSLVQSIIILIVLILLTFWLKKRNIVKSENSRIFSRLVTEFTLPALIFTNISSLKLFSDRFEAAAIMFISILTSMFIAWMFGKLVKLENKRLGAFIVVSGFGSSSTLGYPLIKQVFANTPNAMVDAMVIGELGVCLPFFITGAFILIYYGNRDNAKSILTSTLLPFLRSPIFISIVLGVIFSMIEIPKSNICIKIIFNILNIIGDSMMIFVAISIGLMLKPVKIQKILVLIIIIAIIKLAIEPFLSLLGSNLLNIGELEKQVLFIEAAMPSGALAAVLADRYSCDGSFATYVIIITYLISLISLPLMYYFGIVL